jgi:hypothetical protein
LRVNNTNSAGTSSWSNIESFYTESPYIKILSPNGGEKFYLDSTYVIRWESNITDTVNIQLIKGNNIASVIGDTVIAGTNAFQWHVLSSLPQDTIYKIKISSISNADLFDLSNSPFTISYDVTGIRNLNNTIKSYELSQNYPNPFNPSTVIEYSIPQESRVRINIYNVIGQKITTLVDEMKKPGNYEITWNATYLSSGVYFYSINTTGNKGESFTSIKKMILLK